MSRASVDCARPIAVLDATLRGLLVEDLRFISLGFLLRRLSSGNDSDNFATGSRAYRMGDDHYRSSVDSADGTPALFCALNAIECHQRVRIVEDTTGLLERDTMLALVAAVLGLVPF